MLPEMTDEQRSKTWWHTDKFGGGVFLDICCYGCFFSKWLMGDGEESILSYGANLNTPFGDTEDNFAAIVKYDGSKMSVIEGTWSTPRVVIPSGPMVLCTNGVITCTGGAENAPDVKAYDIYGNEVEIPDVDFGDEYKNGFISVTVSTKPLNGDEFATSLIVLYCKEVYEEIGATYVKQDSDMEVWLCPVTKYVFGKFPETIYIRLW